MQFNTKASCANAVVAKSNAFNVLSIWELYMIVKLNNSFEIGSNKISRIYELIVTQWPVYVEMSYQILELCYCCWA